MKKLVSGGEFSIVSGPHFRTGSTVNNEFV
jgi:hypothetical protein